MGLELNQCGEEVIQVMEFQRRRKRQSCEQLRCPRCDSLNTKFCYYNNYNKSQPRHLCKACKRHWTEGGTLRTVPIGGGRKNRRPKSAISNKASAMEIDDLRVAIQRTPYLQSEFHWTPTVGLQRSMDSDMSSSSSYVQSELLEESTMAGQWPLEDACCWALEEIEALVSTDISPLWDDNFGESKP